MEVILLILLNLLARLNRCCLSLVLFVSFLFCSNSWVAEYDGHVWYESDFYRFYPEYDWGVIDDKDTKNSILTAFLKQNVAAQQALSLGLNYSFDVDKKIVARHKMLLVNEYYMRHFLGSLIPYSSLVFCGEHLKNEVYAKHILFPVGEGINKDSLYSVASSVKDSVLMGFKFSDLALKHSSDPSVGVNDGSLGWVQIGKTVPSFQTALFSLCVGCLGVVETDFGVHVVGVDSVRSSHYNNMDKNLYDDYVFRFASAYIEESLKDVAALHDTLLLKNENIAFNDSALLELVSLLDDELLKKGGKRNDVNLSDVLRSYQKVLVSYKGDLLSGAWFANKIETTLHRSAFYSSLDEIKNDFKMILLRDIVYNKALGLGLQNNYSFNSQYLPVKLGVYEKAYMSWLVESVNPPTQDEVEAYYTQNNKGVSLQKQYKSIETILLQQKQKDIKLLYEESIKNRENIKVNMEWFNG